MIGTDEVKPQRAYEYKGQVVIIYAIAEIEKNKSLAIVYKPCINVPNYPIVVNQLEFCNHATLINSADEITAIENEKIKEMYVTDDLNIDTE